MRIAYIAAGAGGMYCGSCIHDNTLAAALIRRGHEVALMPTYTPMRTDEENVSTGQVFYGALNVYLHGKSALFRHTPRALDWLLDRPGLLKLVSKLGASTDPKDLGWMALDVLQGEEGHQAKELDRLVTWLRDDYKPDVVHITNSMFLGLVRRIREELGVPVVVSVQGEDIFFEELHEPFHTAVVEEMRRRASDASLFVSPSRFYAHYMAGILGVSEEQMKVVPLGIKLEGHGESTGPDDEAVNLGYLARICPEKGLHLLVDAFQKLAVLPECANLRLRIAGYLGARDEAYRDECMAQLGSAGLEDRVDYVGEVDLPGKLAFLRSLDILSVPTTYKEPKGLFVLEALADAVPVVLPRHGSFPEMIETTGGGLLVEPESAESLAQGIRELVVDPARRAELGGSGQRVVRERFNDDAMAEATLAIYRGLTG
jgi:glycosyltransferase involved in cell wall biosynthesis